MISLPQLLREKSQNLRLIGVRCKKCATVNFPVRQVCYKCAASDFEPVKLKRSGKIVTYTSQYYVPPMFEPPLTMAIAEIDGGGKVMTNMTDYEPDKMEIGMEVELVPRKLQEDEGKVLYGWSFRPRRIKC